MRCGLKIEQGIDTAMWRGGVPHRLANLHRQLCSEDSTDVNIVLEISDINISP